MGKTIQIKRGAKSTMPTLAQGEFGFVTDANAEELHIGNGSKNIQIARQDAVDAKYTKPSAGIPSTDLASDVRTSLGKANTAIQSLDGYATVDFVNSTVGNIGSILDEINGEVV